MPPIAKRAGRPSKLSQALSEKLCAAIADGLSYEGACRKAGVARSTFHAWRRRGQETTSGQYRIFSDQIREAEAVALMRLEDALMASAIGGYAVTEKRTVKKEGKVVEEVIATKTAAPNGPLLLQILERRKPGVWGKRDKLDITSNDKPLEVSLFGNVGFGTGNDTSESDDMPASKD